MTDLKRAAKAAGGTLNDAFLAIILGGLGEYHRRRGCAVEQLSVFMPVSVRKAGDPAGGNRIATARFSGPAAIKDPAARIAALADQARAAREEPALKAIEVVAPILNRLPSVLGGFAIAHLGVNADVGCSNVPGLREPAYLAGARIDRLFGFGPLAGTALLATLNSHVDTACIAVNADATVIVDKATLVDCLTQALDEVLELAASPCPEDPTGASSKL